MTRRWAAPPPRSCATGCSTTSFTRCALKQVHTASRASRADAGTWLPQYPSDVEKTALAKRTGLKRSQGASPHVCLRH